MAERVDVEALQLRMIELGIPGGDLYRWITALIDERNDAEALLLEFFEQRKQLSSLRLSAGRLLKRAGRLPEEEKTQ